MTIPVCWELSQAWYTGRLDRNWQRPDQKETQRLFEHISLTGNFWNLDNGKRCINRNGHPIVDEIIGWNFHG